MTWYGTEYRVKPFPGMLEAVGVAIERYSGYIWGEDREQAIKHAEERGIGEIVYGGSRMYCQYPPYVPICTRMDKMTVMPSYEQAIQILHHACWLSYLASNTLSLDPEQIVGDNGIVHHLIHWINSGGHKRPLLIEAIEGIERAVPGYWPKDKPMTGDIDEDLLRELQGLASAKE